MKAATSPPASRSGRTVLRSARHDPTASSSSRTRIPFPRPRGERLDEPSPDGVDVEDEKLRVQMVPGGSDQGEDGLVRLVPAAKEGDAVPLRRRRRSRREEDLAAPLPDVGGELLGSQPMG